jgi:cytosine/adenosine deaminase-related metal-dependent hydrolase
MTIAPASQRLALRGDLLDFTATPAWGDVDPAGLRWRPDHWLLIEAGRIVGAQAGDQPPGDDWQKHDYPDRLILPHLGGEIGSLEVGAYCDVCVRPVAVGPVAVQRNRLARSLHAILFAWMTLADDRNLVDAWVAGVRRTPA